MRLILLKGLPGCGKTTIGRALSKRLSWTLIDKDDIKDVLEPYIEGSGGYSYDVMLAIARRQLLQGLNVICDSPMVYLRTYEQARAIADEASAELMLIECYCSDIEQWQQRINARKTQPLAIHRQATWEDLASYRSKVASEGEYMVEHPLLAIDTVRPLEECLREIVSWLEKGVILRVS